LTVSYRCNEDEDEDEDEEDERKFISSLILV